MSTYPGTILCSISTWTASVLLLFVILGNPDSGVAQNITPKPTTWNLNDAVSIKITPTPIRKLNVEIQRFPDIRLEASSDSRMVFSDNETSAKNRRFYVWTAGDTKLTDTGEDGLSNSVKISDDGRYMVFLHDEISSLRDINGDGTKNVVMRMYHFTSGQKINLDLPARSGTPLPNESRSQFEYRLKDHYLAYSVSDSLDNSQADYDAPWQVMNMLNIVYQIEGTPTPTPTFTPIPVVGTPTPIPTSTPVPTVPPELRSNADINADGVIDTLDLLLFEHFWRVNYFEEQ